MSRPELDNLVKIENKASEFNVDASRFVAAVVREKLGLPVKVGELEVFVSANILEYELERTPGEPDEDYLQCGFLGGLEMTQEDVPPVDRGHFIWSHFPKREDPGIPLNQRHIAPLPSTVHRNEYPAKPAWSELPAAKPVYLFPIS
jgi:hypothetical protein